MNLKNSFLYILGAGLLFSSCSKELQQDNPQAIGDDNAFQTMEHVQLATNGAFGGFSNYSTDVYKSALVSDEVKLGPDNGGAGALTYRYQYGSDGTTGGDVIAGYGGYYGMIDLINRTLPHVNTVSGATQARRDIVQGHLLGLRGMAHFQLLQAFAGNYDPSALGIAVVTQSNAAAKPARNTIAESLTQIENDLTTAKNLLPAVTSANFSDTVLNRLNIAAVQARVALYKRDYTAAITFATEVISSGIRPLATPANYPGIWTDVSPLNNATNEVLFRIRLLQSTALGGQYTNTGGSIFISPSDKLYDAYGTGDIRRDIFIGTNGAGARYVNKHYTSDRGARIVDIKVARTSEMYLIRAEAHARKATPDLTAGAADINAVRTQRIIGYTPVVFASAASLADAVIQEKFKELCFEGIRIYDLKRNSLPVQRNASDASPAWQTLPANSPLFVFPIPRSAILANPNIVQNPGY
jgi:hypothetical protein